MSDDVCRQRPKGQPKAAERRPSAQEPVSSRQPHERRVLEGGAGLPLLALQRLQIYQQLPPLHGAHVVAAPSGHLQDLLRDEGYFLTAPRMELEVDCGRVWVFVH